MTVVTNNVIQGAIDGVAKGTGSGFIPAGVSNIGIGNPSDVITAQTGSDIFYDSANAQFYMAEAVTGSSWVKLGSVA